MNSKLVKLQLITIAILSLVLTGEWAYGKFSATNQLKTGSQQTEENNQTLQLPTIASNNTATRDDNEIVERPLFIEGRKPITITVEENSDNGDLGQLDDWSLIGIYSKDHQPKALFTKKNEARKFLKLGSGQTISGYVLQDIQSDRVVLLQSGQSKAILLRKPRNDSPIPGAGAPPIPGKPGSKRMAKPTPQPNPIPEN